MAATIELVLAMKSRCDSITPRGFPVEPEVLRVHRRCLLAQRIESLRGGKDDPRGGDPFRWNGGPTLTPRPGWAHQRIHRYPSPRPVLDRPVARNAGSQYPSLPHLR